jgi:hypothetical protein
MVRKTFSISFMIRRARMLKNQEVPIYMRITVDGDRAEISTKRSVNPGFWDEVKGCAKSGSLYAKELNFRLEQIKHQIYEHLQDLVSRNKPVTAQTLKNAYLGINKDETRTILQVYQEHNENLKLLINKGVAEGTYERHFTSRKHLESYIQDIYKLNDYFLRDIDHSFVTKYETYSHIYMFLYCFSFTAC